MLGKTIYILDLENNAVLQGVVKQTHITTSGYGACMVDVDGERRQVEMSKCFDNEDAAIEFLARIIPLSNEMKAMVKETNERLDKMRLEILGEPEFKNLID